MRILSHLSQDYLVVSPVRNEASHIEMTIRSVLAQDRLPAQWVLVDDGSTDDTAAIIGRYVAETTWMRLISLPNRGFYDLHRGGEIKAFYRGLESIGSRRFDFLVKLDGDVSLDPHYFSDLLQRFRDDRKLGIASGSCYYDKGGRLVLEKANELQPRGAARMYRAECWGDIGGALKDLAWDVIDVYKARMSGWHTRAFPSIRMIHHVQTNSKGGVLSGRRRQGAVEYLVSTHPLFFMLKAMLDAFRKPLVVGSLAYVWGYAECVRTHQPRLVGPALGEFIRREQLKHLGRVTLGKLGARAVNQDKGS